MPRVIPGPTGPSGPGPAPTGPQGPTGPTAATGPSGPAAPPAPSPVTAGSPYRHLGNTDRNSFKQAMSRTVAGPVPFLAELDGMYDELAARGVTRLAPPMSWMECKNSTYPTCGVPTRCRNPWSVTGAGDAGQSGRWAAYSSYRAAAAAWADLVVNGSPYRSARSIAEFIHIYAPASDNNDEARYVQVIVDGANALPVDGSQPLPQPQPQTVDVVAVIVGGQPTNTDYGFKAPTDLPYYDYFVNHGGTAHEHTGIDATGQIGEPLYSPIDGTVVCAGTGVGQGAHGSSCAAFPFTLGANTGSSGRFEIVTDDGQRSLILGHVQRCLVPLGARVTAGQEVALMGGMNGPHVHIEARIWQGGDYTIVDPRQAFGGGPLPIKRLPVPQPSEIDNPVTVKVVRDGLPVRQRADPAAPEVDTPFKAGDTFQATHTIIGVDNRWWWVGVHDGRVPMDGTEGPLMVRGAA